MKIYPQALRFFLKPQFCRVISCCCFADDDGKEIDKNEKMRVLSLQSYCFCSLNMQICDILISSPLSLLMRPKKFSETRTMYNNNYNSGSFLTGLGREPINVPSPPPSPPPRPQCSFAVFFSLFPLANTRQRERARPLCQCVQKCK